MFSLQQLIINRRTGRWKTEDRLFCFWSSPLVKKPPREAGSQHSQHYAVASHLWLVEEMRQCHICPETSLLKPAVK